MCGHFRTALRFMMSDMTQSFFSAWKARIEPKFSFLFPTEWCFSRLEQLRHVCCASSFKLLLGVSWYSGAAIHLGRKWRWGDSCHGPAEPVYFWIDLPSRAARFTRLCGSRIHCLEPCRRGFDGDCLVMCTCPICAVDRTAYGDSYRTRWWGSMSRNSKASPLGPCGLDKSSGSETLTGM